MDKVVLGLSGGVDSAVAAHLLRESGLEVHGLYLDNGLPGADAAREAAASLSVPLTVSDSREAMEKHVCAPFAEAYLRGETPNPCILCNPAVKFRALLDEARRLGARYIATGHYAQTEIDSEGRKWLVTSPDPVKDQTDFLAQLYDWQLKKSFFPIGHHQKGEVRAIAEREHLVNARRKDSQGICFLGKVNYNDYMRRYLGENPGLVIDIATGKKIGMHKGLWFHTIGQRHGLGFGGGPWFAVKKNIKKNILFVSNGYDPKTAYRQHFPVHDMHFLTCNPWKAEEGRQPVAGKQLLEQGDSVEVCIKIRHTPEYLPATLELDDGGRYIVHAREPIHGVAPGQFCVIYDECHHRCYGSAEITV